MNTNQKKYTAFMESVCKEFNRPEMLPALKEGFKAFCEAIDNPFYSGLKFSGEAFNQAFIELQDKYPNRLHNDSSDLQQNIFSDKNTGKRIWLGLGKKCDADGYFDPNCTIVIDTKSGRKSYPLTVDQARSIDEIRREIVDICSKELDTPDAPTFESIGIYNTMRLTTDEMLLLQEMRQYYQELCRDGWMSDFLHGGGNPLSAADNLALLDALVEMYGSVEDLPEGFLALYHKLGGKKI